MMITKRKISKKERVHTKNKTGDEVRKTEARTSASLIPDLRHEIEDTVTRMLKSWPHFGSTWNWPEFEPLGKIDLPERHAGTRNLPRVDFSEINDGYEITAELPGMGEDDVECTLSGNILTVKGEKQEEREEEKKGYYLKERNYGSFMRNFTLPEDVDTDKLEASVSDGVLRVSMPKCADKQRLRKIKVKKS